LNATIITCPNCGKRNRVAPRPEGTPRCANCQHDLPWIVDADESSFDAEVAASVPVLVDLWAPWCGPCKWVAPVVERAAADHVGAIKVVRVDIDQAPAIARRFDVVGIPTLVLLRQGSEVERLAGAPAKAALQAWISGQLEAKAASES
jgi:thioredoxin 2